MKRDSSKLISKVLKQTREKSHTKQFAKRVTLTGLLGVSTLGANAVLAANSANTPYGLQAIYQMALSYDAAIAQAKAQFESDSQATQTARGALLPQVQADGSYFVTDSDNDFADNHAKALSLTLNQSLYKHDNWARYNQSKYAVEAAHYSYQLAEQELILRVAQAYFDVLLAQKTLSLAKDKLKADTNQYETAQASFELGLVSQVDVQQTISNLDLSKADVISAENALDVVLEKLANITGTQVEALKAKGLKSVLADVKLPNLEIKKQAVVDIAQQRNLNVKLASAQLNQAQEEISVQKAGHMPSVSFQAQYTDQDYSELQAGSNLSDSQSTRYGINVTMPLFSGGTTSSQVTAAKKQTMAAQEALRQSKQSASLEARTVMRNLEQGQKLVAALREAVKSNNAFVESAQEGYRVGVNTLLEVLTARSNQTNAQKNLIEAIHNQILNHFQLEASLGSLDVEDILQYEPLLQVTE